MPIVKRTARGSTLCCILFAFSEDDIFKSYAIVSKHMLIHGTCNPCGESNDYDGVYLTSGDIEQIVGSNALVNAPVLLEHDGAPVGHVKSAWRYNDQLDVLVELDDAGFLGRVAESFVAANVLLDFSLGYKVELSRASDNTVRVGAKKIVELSLVKTGARPNCQIKNFVR
jgi:hypothetical protein